MADETGPTILTWWKVLYHSRGANTVPMSHASTRPRDQEMSVPTLFNGLPGPFRWLWLGQLVNRLGALVQPFLALYLTGPRGFSAQQAGLLVALAGVGSLLSQVIGGWLTDRVGRRFTMLLGLCTSAISLLWLGYSKDIVWVASAACVVGLTIDLYRPAVSATVADIVPPPARSRAYGLLFWAINLGFSVATVSAGLLARHGFTILFWVDAATSAACAVVIWRGVPETRPISDIESGRPGAASAILRDRPFMALVGITTLYAAVYFQGTTTLPIVMHQVGMGTATYGWVIAINGVLIVAVQPLVLGYMGRRDPATVYAVSMAIAGTGFGITALAHNAVGFAISVVVWTLGEIGAATVMNVIVAALAPVPLRGRYMGGFGLAWGLAGVTGPLAGTAVLEQLGSATLWTGCFALGLSLCAAQLALAPVIRRRAAAGP